jgi:hypothetical protein
MKKQIYNFKIIFIFDIISLKTNTFVPVVLQRHYPIPVVVLQKICTIPLYNCNHLLIRRKTLTSEEEFEFWEEIEVRGSQIWRIGLMFPQFIVPLPNTFVGVYIVLMKDDFFLLQTGLFSRIFSSSLVKRLE